LQAPEQHAIRCRATAACHLCYIFPVITPDHTIDIVQTEEQRHAASLLLGQRYAWRGYGGKHVLEEHAHRVSLCAMDKGMTVGTATIGFDSAAGLLADTDFKDVIDGYRMQGGRVCEITKLAMAPAADTRKTLASLFHAVFMYAHIKHRCTDMFIEINPRHRRYYEAMLDFLRLGDARHNQRVYAPGFLMWSSMDHIAQQIATLAGTASSTSAARSLYPHFLAPADAASLANHLLKKPK